MRQRSQTNTCRICMPDRYGSPLAINEEQLGFTLKFKDKQEEEEVLRVIDRLIAKHPHHVCRHRGYRVYIRGQRSTLRRIGMRVRTAQVNDAAHNLTVIADFLLEEGCGAPGAGTELKPSDLN